MQYQDSQDKASSSQSYLGQKSVHIMFQRHSDNCFYSFNIHMHRQTIGICYNNVSYN